MDQVDSGLTLDENYLSILDILMETKLYLIGNNESLKTKTDQTDLIILCVKGVLEARKRVLLKVNATTEEIKEKIAKMLPAMKSPDISNLASGGYSLATAVPKIGSEELVMQLKSIGGTDVLVSELKLIIP